ncbi:MAG: hypothetical protein R2771_03995 [Saprospiraceae bacterium]
MKNLLKICILIFISIISVLGQIPNYFSFQGIALDYLSNPISEQMIGVEVKIIQGSMDGNVQYIETHNVETNANGLYSLSIGQGTQKLIHLVISTG